MSYTQDVYMSHGTEQSVVGVRGMFCETACSWSEGCFVKQPVVVVRGVFCENLHFTVNYAADTASFKL
jgi:hypothetical protein